MPRYYPSMVCNFKIKFDEALTLKSPGAPDTVQRRVESPPQGAGTTSDAPLLTSQEDSTASILVARIPKGGSVELPGYRQAGQFSLTFDFRDFPIDPRTLRAASVDIHLGTVSADNAAAGFRGEKANGTLKSVLATRDPRSGAPNSSTLIMTGLIDDIEVHHTNSGSEVSMKGRDLRGILIDVPLGAGAPGAQQQMLDELNLAQPIDAVVRDILKSNPLFPAFNVVVNAAEWPNGQVPECAMPDKSARHRKGARGKRTSPRSTPAGGQQMSFWDLIVKFCFLVGGIPYFKGRELYIRPSRTIFDQLRGDVDPIANPTPFKGGALRIRDALSRTALTPPLRVRRMVYGRDIVSLNYTRKFTGFQKPKIVQCVSYDPSQGQGTATANGQTTANDLIIGYYPDPNTTNPKALTHQVAPGGNKAQSDVLSVPVPGIVDPAALAEIARSIYEEIGRGEMGGSVETKALCSFGGDDEDPDLLRLSPGDGVELLTETRALDSGQPLVSTYTDHERNSFSDQVAKITARLGDADLARTIVATARGQNAQVQQFFRVQTVKYAWSAKDGLKVHFDFQNYYVARNQIDSASPVQGHATRTSTPKS